MIYVPPALASGAIAEAADAGIRLIVCITEGIPVLDMARILPFVREKGARLIGPNCPGLITPGVGKVGIIPGQICAPGRIGLVSRSGTLTYEVVNHLTRNGIGQSTCVGIGGDPLIGTNFIDVLRAFEADPGTDAMVMLGEIGGTDEQQAAQFVAGPPHQTGHRLHRRADRPQGPPNGACRRHHLRILGNRRREDPGVRNRGDPRDANDPSTWWSWST